MIKLICSPNSYYVGGAVPGVGDNQNDGPLESVV